MSERIRVLVVDDSALMRKLIPAILARDSSIEVVGTAMDGAFALKKIQELQPDVVTLDLEMPRMDGMEMLRLIMRSAPLPIILFSTHSKEGGYATMKALEPQLDWGNTKADQAGVVATLDAANDQTVILSSTSVSVSRIRGTLSSVTGCSVSSAAAMIGSAAFLLPDGSIVPASRWPPSTMY